MKKNLFNNQKLVLLTVLSLFLSLTLNAQAKKIVAQKKKAPKNETATNSPEKDKGAIVSISTNYGVIKVKLYDATPKHQENFLRLTKTGFYDSLLFHRVIPSFMIQGGDPTSKQTTPDGMLGSGDVGYKIPAEFVDALYHKRGALAAARDNNPEMQSSGCQFYIVQGKKVSDAELNGIEQRTGKKYTAEQRKTYNTIGGTPFLDHAYTVFGEVIEGMEVVDKITAVPIGSNDRPRTDVVIQNVRVIQ